MSPVSRPTLAIIPMITRLSATWLIVVILQLLQRNLNMLAVNFGFTLLVVLTLTLSVVKSSPTKNPLVRNEGKTTYKIRLTKAICVDLPYEIAWNVTCRLKLYRDQPSRMLFRVEVDQVDHIFLTFAMYYKYHLTYQPLLMETTFDVCSYLEKFKNRGYASVAPSLDQTAMFILSILEKNNPTAIRTGCPYKGVVAFEDFRIDESMAPQFLPAGEYRLDMRYFNEKNQTVMHSQVFGSVRAIGIVDLSMG
ncbi:uncharacterized protein LOC5571206 [Aedes aegypti]|uniref:Uncharacterized protein n=1 Tax=Aedes aegypti TaxID=7159 RepID=A0A1S4FKP7_AEDAE|nr:uncharacterized protein LOC5571206 [Aedes aegypti]